MAISADTRHLPQRGHTAYPIVPGAKGARRVPHLRDDLGIEHATAGSNGTQASQYRRERATYALPAQAARLACANPPGDNCGVAYDNIVYMMIMRVLIRTFYMGGRTGGESRRCVLYTEYWPLYTNNRPQYTEHCRLYTRREETGAWRFSWRDGERPRLYVVYSRGRGWD